MDIVLNKCWGGFGLSNEAMQLLYERGFKYIKTSSPEEYYGSKEYDLKDLIRKSSDKGYSSFIYDEEKNLVVYLEYENVMEFRTDPMLVQVVKELGTEKASSYLGEIYVTYAPGTEGYEIDDYDGIERVIRSDEIYY